MTFTPSGLDDFQVADDNLTDTLRSTIALTDSTGAIRQRYSYDPYGNTEQSDTTTGFTNPYQYTGREADTPSLYYYRARYYSSLMGGFISQDKLWFGGGQLSFYAYVDGDPADYADPSGLGGPVSGPRAPPSFSWQRPPGAGGDYGRGVSSGPSTSILPDDPEQTPGAWPGGFGDDPEYTVVCVKGVCRTDQMECHANYPDVQIVPVAFGTYPPVADYSRINPGCKCIQTAFLDQVLPGDSSPGPTASNWDKADLIMKIHEVIKSNEGKE